MIIMSCLFKVGCQIFVEFVMWAFSSCSMSFMKACFVATSLHLISSCVQSRRFPEDPGVGHQSSGRQNHQCILSWRVSCLCYWTAVFGDLRFTGLWNIWVTTSIKLNVFFVVAPPAQFLLPVLCRIEMSRGLWTEVPSVPLTVLSYWKLKHRCLQMYH